MAWRPAGNALGLYFRDTRYLARWELRLDGARPLYLHAQAERRCCGARATST